MPGSEGIMVVVSIGGGKIPLSKMRKSKMVQRLSTPFPVRRTQSKPTNFDMHSKASGIKIIFIHYLT